MGSTMKPTIFNDRVAAALKNWHHMAKKHTKHSKHSESNTPLSSRPTTPTHGMSPVHLLHSYPHRSVDSYNNSPMHPNFSNFDNERWDPESLRSPHHHEIDESPRHGESSEQEMAIQEPRQMQLPPGPGSIRVQHEFSFPKWFSW